MVSTSESQVPLYRIASRPAILYNWPSHLVSGTLWSSKLRHAYSESESIERYNRLTERLFRGYDRGVSGRSLIFSCLLPFDPKRKEAANTELQKKG